jgi:hypothetical protein
VKRRKKYSLISHTNGPSTAMKGKTYAVFHYDFHLKNRKMEIFMA